MQALKSKIRKPSRSKAVHVKRAPEGADEKEWLHKKDDIEKEKLMWWWDKQRRKRPTLPASLKLDGVWEEGFTRAEKRLVKKHYLPMFPKISTKSQRAVKEIKRSARNYGEARVMAGERFGDKKDDLAFAVNKLGKHFAKKRQ